jgi:hypothetical protein
MLPRASPQRRLRPYSAKARRELLKAIEHDIANLPATPAMGISDFNLPPPSRGWHVGRGPKYVHALSSMLASAALDGATSSRYSLYSSLHVRTNRQGTTSNSAATWRSYPSRSDLQRPYRTIIQCRNGSDGFTDDSALIIDLYAPSIAVAQGKRTTAFTRVATSLLV